MKILIDNGHGENTAGKRSPDGMFREYQYAREIACETERRLRSMGYDAERIVKENVDVPLAERVSRVNDACREHGVANVLLVSIHCNAAGSGAEWMSARGWSAYTTKGRTKSDALAECLYAEAEKNFPGMKLRKDKQDGDSDWEEDFYILRKTKCAAVLTENFFQDNKEDVLYLISYAGREAVVKTHVDGIVSYIKTYGKGV